MMDEKFNNMGITKEREKGLVKTSEQKSTALST